MSAFYDEIHARYGDPVRFVSRTKSKMRLHGITQGALARRAGYDPANVSAWLGTSRRLRPSMETMVVLDEALERLIKGE